MMRYLWLLIMLLSTPSRAGEIQYLVPEYITMELHDIYAINDPYLYPRDKELRFGGAFVTNFHLLEWKQTYIYSNNRLSFEQSEKTGKVIHGGWQFSVGGGYSFTDHQSIELGKYHYSYHVFEEPRPEHFPTFDSYYINLVIYKR